MVKVSQSRQGEMHKPPLHFNQLGLAVAEYGIAGRAPLRTAATLPQKIRETAASRKNFISIPKYLI